MVQKLSLTSGEWTDENKAITFTVMGGPEALRGREVCRSGERRAIKEAIGILLPVSIVKTKVLER